MKRFATRAVLVAFVILAGLAAAGALYSPDLTIPPGVAGQQLEVNGLPLRVLQEGKGRDILMIHGSPGMLEDFDELAARLRDSFRVTRYDRPGMGFSGDPGDYSLRSNARTALALIEKLGLDHVVVVGHSFGGSTAMALAEMNSPRVAAIVVLDSAVYAPIRPVRPVFRYLRLPGFGLGLARVVPRSSLKETVRKGIVEEFKAGPPPEPFMTTARLDALTEPKVMHAMANEHWSSAGELAAQSPDYGTIGVPVHVVAQRDDPARKAAAERLHAELPRGELLLVSPSGHFVQIEQVAAVSELVRRAAQAD